MPSVTSALQTLAGKGLIRYQSHAPVVLTAAGTERAAVIRLRHAALKHFFKDMLKLTADDANVTACKVEHVVCEKVMSRFVTLTDAIMNRGDCADLRQYLEQDHAQICSNRWRSLFLWTAGRWTVRNGGPGQQQSARNQKKFADLGLVTELFFQMEGRAPVRGSAPLRVMGSSLSMRSKDARHIWLRLTKNDHFAV